MSAHAHSHVHALLQGIILVTGLGGMLALCLLSWPHGRRPDDREDDRDRDDGVRAAA